MNQPFSLVGIGIGPFNLSLAALLAKTPRLPHVFLERKERFEWHSELLLPDSVMQTTWLKDLVTPVDPTSPHSFLNYLVDQGLFYAFLHTGRRVISRREFEQYCAWVSEQLGERLRFGENVREVDFRDGVFRVRTEKGVLEGKNICVATGAVPRVPECAEGFLGENVFHAKSPRLRDLNLEGKCLLIVGGGQTGVEVFRNALAGRWGRAASLRLVTARRSLEPLDETAFTNEYFTPAYANEFWNFPEENKRTIVDYQKLASDGNTPAYLADLFHDLYQRKHVERDPREIEILAGRTLAKMSQFGKSAALAVRSEFSGKTEELRADIVVLATGFRQAIPPCLDPLRGRIPLDEHGRFRMNRDFSVAWDGGANRIFALNFSRHAHGISEPQTSLMAWRAANVVNSLAGEPIYLRPSTAENFVRYGDTRGEL